MYLKDAGGQKRMELGDKSCEILLAIKKRCKEFTTPQGGPTFVGVGMSAPHSVAPPYVGPPIAFGNASPEAQSQHRLLQ